MPTSSAASGTSGELQFQAFLNQYGDNAWREVINNLLDAIHEVDREATQIWFYFYPIALLRALQSSEEPDRLVRKLRVQGKYLVKDQIDSSHEFLYGHRFWPHVKQAVSEHAASAAPPASLDLATQIREVAGRLGQSLKTDPSQLTGITAVAFMTLQQAGAAALKAAPGKTGRLTSQSPEQILKQRARGDGQGPLGILRGDRKRYTVTFDESDPAARFTLISTQHITTAAATDKRDYHSSEPRCIVGEGPIPVECRSASCGTCWVGVLGGAEKLSEVAGLEWTRIKEFGYINTDDSKPLIRLACQAQAFGSVSIVIPPWNGVFGRYLRGEKSALDETENEAGG